MRAICAFYIVLIFIVTLVGVAFLGMSYGDNVEMGRAVYQHHIAPSEATRQKLAEVRAANNRALIPPSCLLGVFFVGSIFVVVRTTRRLQTRTI